MKGVVAPVLREKMQSFFFPIRLLKDFLIEVNLIFLMYDTF